MWKPIAILTATVLAVALVPSPLVAAQTEGGSIAWTRVEVNFSDLPTSGPYVTGAGYETTTLAVQQGTRIDPRRHAEIYFYVVYWNDRYVATSPSTLQLIGFFQGANQAEVGTFTLDRDLGSAVLDADVPAASCFGPECEPRQIHAVWAPIGPLETHRGHWTGWYQLDSAQNWIDVRPSDDPDFRWTASTSSERRAATAQVWVNGTLAPATSFYELSIMERGREAGSWTCFTSRCPFD